MKMTEEFLNGLVVDESQIIEKIADEIEVRANQVSVTVKLLKEDCTIPFISRYRKEMTGSLDETKVREISHRMSYLEHLESRKIEIARIIFAQGKLSDELFSNIMKCGVASELEELYAPYKKKKKTRGMLAVERGLEPLADLMQSASSVDVDKAAPEFLNEELGVATIDDALSGAMDIIAERFSQDIDSRKRVRSMLDRSAKFVIEGKGDAESSTYGMYYDYSENVSTLKPHRVLAMNRGEKEGELIARIDFDLDYVKSENEKVVNPKNPYHKMAVEDGLKRLLLPSVLREMRSDLTLNAESHSIEIFSTNLKNLLLQPPISRRRVLGVDPGIRTGTKCAALDENGKYLSDIKFYQHRTEEAKKMIADIVKKHDIELIAIGNGTGSHDVQKAVAEAISEYKLNVKYTVVSEDGASVYSASPLAGEEFPQLDLTVRGAISIGRRLQDPLAEYVKIDPQSLGVGQYQHDVNQKRLSETLDESVESVVNSVGVNLNTASPSLLKYVSGVTPSLAKHITAHREENGSFHSRKELLKVSGMGAKSFEQCAGFLMIPSAEDKLDNSWVHPENYEIAREVMELLEKGDKKSVKSLVGEKHGVGDTTLRDIMEELKKPGRDPREDYPKPIFQKGVLSFEDLKVGMKVKGKVTNVVDFGAFIDIGIKENGMLHISEMSDSYVKHPTDVVKVGDVVECSIIKLDEARKRIGLSRKTRG